MHEVASPNTATPPKLLLNIRVLMQKNGIRTVSVLKKRLQTVGIEISNAQLGRFVDNSTTRLDRDLLAALLFIFQCSIEELFFLEENPPAHCE